MLSLSSQSVLTASGRILLLDNNKNTEHFYHNMLNCHSVIKLTQHTSLQQCQTKDNTDGTQMAPRMRRRSQSYQLSWGSITRSFSTLRCYDQHVRREWWAGGLYWQENLFLPLNNKECKPELPDFALAPVKTTHSLSTMKSNRPSQTRNVAKESRLSDYSEYRTANVGTKSNRTCIKNVRCTSVRRKWAWRSDWLKWFDRHRQDRT